MLTFICIASFASSAAMRISLVPCEIIQLREWSGFNVCMCCVSVRARMPIHSIQLNHYRINYMLLWCSMFFLQIPFQIYYFFTLFCCCCSHSCFYLLCACVRFFRSVDGFHFLFGRRARNERVRVNPDIWNNFDFIFRFYVCAHGCVCDCVCASERYMCCWAHVFSCLFAFHTVIRWERMRSITFNQNGILYKRRLETRRNGCFHAIRIGCRLCLFHLRYRFYLYVFSLALVGVPPSDLRMILLLWFIAH